MYEKTWNLKTSITLGHQKLITGKPRIQGWTSKANIFNILAVVGYGLSKLRQLALHSIEVCKRVLNLTEVFWRPVALHIIGSKQSRSIKKSSVHLKVCLNHTGKSQHRNNSIYFMAAFHAANGQANQANTIRLCMLIGFARCKASTPM